MSEKELLTGKQIAEKLGISAGKVSKYLKENDVAPDGVKGVCKYYGAATVKKIEKALK